MLSWDLPAGGRGEGGGGFEALEGHDVGVLVRGVVDEP